MPVPFDDIFPSTIIEGAETFDVEFDPVSNSTSSSSASSGTSTPDDDENSEAFGEVFIDSPNGQSVSSLAPVSDWVVTSCDPKSDQPQTVSMRCQPPFPLLIVTQTPLIMARFSLTVLSRWIALAVRMSSLEALSIQLCKCPRLADLALTLVSRV